MTDLEPRLSRLLAIALLVAAIGAMYRLTVVPATSLYSERTAAIEQTADRLHRFRRIAARAPALARAMKQAESRNDFGQYLLPGGSPALAAAALQEQVKGLVGEGQGQLASTQVVRPARDGDFTRISINARAFVDLDGLQRLMHQLESARPLLVVDDLMILVRRARARGKPDTGTDTLDVRFRLSGFTRQAAEG